MTSQAAAAEAGSTPGDCLPSGDAAPVAAAANAPATAAAAAVTAQAQLIPIQPLYRTLRLATSSGALERLQEAPIIRQHARNRGVVRRMETIYYDTADRALFGSGLSLRVQRQGRRFVQIVKRHGPGRQMPTGPAWETPLDNAAPDLSRLAGSAIPLALIERLAAEPLAALFETRLRRQLRRLELPGALIDIAFDEGVIEASAQQQDVAEIRLLLQQGEAGALYDIGMRLLELAPLRVNTASMTRRGYDLASGLAPRAEKAAPSLLSPAAAVDDMITAVMSGCQLHLQANQVAAEVGSSPDGVHQMRVALRRMRSAFSLLRQEIPSATIQTLSGEAKFLADQLGPARGWDVFVSTTLTAPARLATPGSDFDGLRGAAEAPRQLGYDSVREMLASARFGRFQLAMSQWIARRGWRNEVDRGGLTVLAEPARSMAVRVLSRLHRKALRQGRHFKRLSAEERHELRITLKKLRYASEFFLPLWPEPGAVQRFIARLSVLQDALGLDHDAATTQPLLDEIGRATRAAGVHQAIGIVIGWQGRDSLAAGADLAKGWRQFRDLAPFWGRAPKPELLGADAVDRPSGVRLVPG